MGSTEKKRKNEEKRAWQERGEKESERKERWLIVRAEAGVALVRRGMLQSTTKRPSLATLFFRRPLSIHARTLQRAGQSSPRRPPRPLHRVPWPTEAAESARWPRQGASWPAWPRWWKSHPQGRDRLPQGRDCVQGTPERLTVKHQLCTLRRSFRSPSASETTPSQRRDVSGHGPCE